MLLVFDEAVSPKFENLKWWRNKILVWAMRILGGCTILAFLSIPFQFQ